MLVQTMMAEAIEPTANGVGSDRDGGGRTTSM
jgi:hypothetical protein